MNANKNKMEIQELEYLKSGLKDYSTNHFMSYKVLLMIALKDYELNLGSPLNNTLLYSGLIGGDGGSRTDLINYRFENGLCRYMGICFGIQETVTMRFIQYFLEKNEQSIRDFSPEGYDPSYSEDLMFIAPNKCVPERMSLIKFLIENISSR